MIRRFKKEDAKRCAEIINECHKSMPELQGKELEFLLKKYTPDFTREEFPKEYVLVSEESGEIFGLGALLEGCEMRWVYIDPKKQGKGLGTSLVRKIEDEVKNRGFNKIVLKSYYGSKTFYEKLGYKVIKKDTNKIGDATINSIVMEKLFDSN